MNPLDLVRCGIERLDSLSKAVTEAQHNLHGMDGSDYSAAQRGMLDELDQKRETEYFCPESFGLRLIADWENTLLRGFLRWAVVQAHKPSSAVHSLLQMYSSDDAAKYVVPKPKGDMKVALVRVTDLPELLDHWYQRVVSGPAEEEMVEVCRSNKPNFRRPIFQGLFVLAWKVPGDYGDMWMDGQGFAIPDVPESI
ncbi:hypothetical protein FPRO05_09970 [Fusarium proliferatum]|uniref:Uncharacterized protein n=1 Tax=Gibberella intermedia TaxID=948311 RepID=A0A365NDZ6_GIBIN|nr:hypothetical protein FPRO05_09970 [Fusarium proliferatum]